jgi:pimeloyl-ACP methyl ester carboxylesterase
MAKRRPATRQTSASRSVQSADWAFHADDDAVLDALVSGRHAQSLREYFGTPAYAQLSVLAAAAKRAKKPRGPKVLILPGIMGSKIGAATRDAAGSAGARSGARHRGAFPRVLWIDPLQIAAGRLTALALPSGRALCAVGVLLFSYAKLKLELELGGREARFHAYDWRLGLDELGAQLAASIVADRKPVILVAHSMGGLVARMAARMLPKRWVRRLIMLGTPNEGSFASVQALRGTYPFVRKMSRLDHRHSAEYLAAKVFNTFPGLYHMLPSRRMEGIDLFDPRGWPADGPTPSAGILRQVAAVRAALAPADSRMVHIVGVNQETVVGMRRTAAGFEYVMTRNGDGTVPLPLATLPKLKSYFVDELHGNLANNAQVIRAVLDLVRRGRTRQLPDRWRLRRAPVRRIDDAHLRTENGEKIDWERLTSAEREAAIGDLDSGRPVIPG